MPRKMMRKLIPHPTQLKGSWMGRVMGDLFKDPYLFHLNRRSVSLGVMIGLFWAFTPIPTQMIPAALTAWVIRANLPIAVALVWISNPITMPPILFGCYLLVAWVLDVPVMPPAEGASIEWFKGQLMTIWQPLLLGSLLISVVSAVSGYVAMRLWWIAQVKASWKLRQLRRVRHPEE